MISYTRAQTQVDLLQILDLQAINLEASLDESSVQEQGFVTVRHNLDLLTRMNEPYPHILAKEEGRVVGYALVMLPARSRDIPVLQSLFERLGALTLKEKSILDYRYFVMGQICIDESYRGMGIFEGMYGYMKDRMKDNFDLIITSIATRNTRSMRAHEKVGFTILEIYTAQGANPEEWAIVAWDLSQG